MSSTRKGSRMYSGMDVLFEAERRMPKIELNRIALSKKGDDRLLIFGDIGGQECLLADVEYIDVEDADPEKLKELALEICEQLDYDVEGVGVDIRI